MASIRVLHVDDEPRFLEFTATFLPAIDDRLSVVTEPTPADGLDRLAADTIDCVVSDHRMPSMTGIEFLHAVRTDHPTLPFILFTGEWSETVASGALAAGATDYLQKRSGTEQYELLANRIRNAVEAQRAQRALRRHEQLLEAIDEPGCVLDATGTVRLATPALADLLEYDRAALVGMDADEFLLDGAHTTDRSPDRDETPTRSLDEVAVETADGRRIPVDRTTVPIAAAAVDGRVVVLRPRPPDGGHATFISPSRSATAEMSESSQPTPTTDPARRTTDDHGHDIVSPLQAGLVTVSTSRAEAADPDDPGGDRIAALFDEAGHRVVDRRLVADGIEPIQDALGDLVAEPTVDLVVVTGGTGPTADDVTPEAASALFDRELPGFGELFRRLSSEEIGTRVVATRATAGIANATPVFVVPGSTNAVELATEAIVLEEAPHLVGLSTRHLTDDGSM